MNSYIDESHGYTVERGIHGIFPAYKNFKNALQEIGFKDTLYSKTKTTGMVGSNGIESFELDKVHGPSPLFLFKLIPKGFLRYEKSSQAVYL